MENEKFITIKIYENDRVEILDEDGKHVEPVSPNDERYVPLTGPKNCYEQILWYTGSPICVWHRGRLH